MAKILTTAIVADIRNKLNGSVFSKNRYGSYVRTKVTPVNPQSTAQQNVRNRLSTNSQAWRGLTEAQRNSWINAAANFPTTDIFGNPKILSGNALYVGLNNNLAVIGVSPIPGAPSPVAIPAILTIALTAAAGTPALDLVTTPATIPVGFNMVIEATPQIPPGQNFVKNKFRFLSSVAASGSGTQDLIIPYTAKFGAPVAGKKIFVRVKLISSTTGQTGIPLQAVAIVAV